MTILQVLSGQKRWENLKSTRAAKPSSKDDNEDVSNGSRRLFILRGGALLDIGPNMLITKALRKANN